MSISMTQILDRRLYPDYEKNWDDQLFRERILSVLDQEKDVLDLGAGAGIVEHMNFRGKARRICGIDPDPRVTSNPYLDEGREGLGESIPYPDNSFDVVFADNVLEHLPNPLAVFEEVKRVLRPGGVFLAKTPNKWHYMPTIARMTPLAFHQWINKRRGRNETDTFPTRYRANTVKDVSGLANTAGLQVDKIDLIEGRPEYLRLLAPAYIFGWLYECTVNSVAWLASFRILLVITLKKPH